LYNYLDSELIRFDTTGSLLDYLAAFPGVTSEALRRLRRDRRRLKKAEVEKDKDAIRLF
jgi:hypothetical protein